MLRFGLGGMTLLALSLAMAGCSKKEDAQPLTNAPAAAVAPAPTPSAAPTAVAARGFDPATAPQGTAPTGAFPYFGLLAGYALMTRKKITTASSDRTSMTPITTITSSSTAPSSSPSRGGSGPVEAVGTGRSFFEAQKNYEKLIHDLGGVTVWEGGGQAMDDLHLDYAERRHRDRYNGGNAEKMGIYMVRTPTNQIWVEVYQTSDEHPDNYWLTIVETKALDVSAKLVPAAALKQALDSAGHVALYVNFATDQTAVLPTSQPMLAEVVKLLVADPALKLTIEGHTDNAGTPPHNQTLSQGRANAVMGMLIAQGIDPARLAAKGLGQTRPIADNGAEEGRAKNRRVELVRR